MSSFVIKIIACVTMLLDHIKYAIPFTENWITIFGGRISFPLFAFLITEGYIHTRNLKKYYIRLIIFALISQIPFMLFRSLVGEWKMLNIMFTLLLGLSSITIYEKIKNKYISLSIVGMIIFIGSIINVDYGWFGVASVFIIYVLKKYKIMLAAVYSFIIAVYYYVLGFRSFDIMYLIIFTAIIPSAFMMLYNGKQGKKTKYFFYIFYPFHMLILFLINIVFY